jgi:hypothetical protein
MAAAGYSVAFSIVSEQSNMRVRLGLLPMKCLNHDTNANGSRQFVCISSPPESMKADQTIVGCSFKANHTITEHIHDADSSHTLVCLVFYPVYL